MATVTKPIALDESLNTTEVTPRNIADVLAEGLKGIEDALPPTYTAGDGIDISDDEISVDTTFTEASTRTNIASGDSLATIWGKIKKFFTDLKAVAFSGAAADATYDPTASGLAATDVQEAIDEVTEDVKAASVQYATGDSFALVPTSAGNALATTIYGTSTQDGTPTPSTPVAIESASANFKCVGKNLIPYPYRIERTDGNPFTTNAVVYTSNSDGTLTVSGTANGGNANYYLTDWRDENASLIKAGTYTLSGCPAGGNTTTYCLILYCFQVGTTNGTEVSPVVHIYDEGNGATFTLTEDVWGRIYFRVANGAAAPSEPIKPVLRLASVTDATYEPYKHTDITTSLTLRSIEVTSSDPYNLVKDGHYYIADTIDWDEVDGYTLTQRVKETVFDGTETDWTTGTSSVSGVVLFRKVGFFDYNTNTKFATKCNRFVCISSYSDPNRNHDGYISLAASNYAIYFGLLDSVASTVDQFKTWLSTNNVTVLSAQTPTKTSLTSAQAKALLSMRTYNESTSIDAVNAPAPVMELEYAKARTPALALTGHNMAHINAIDIGNL